MSSLDRLTNFISRIQTRNIFDRERCRQLVRILFLCIGLTICLNFTLNLLKAGFLLSRFLFQVTFQCFSFTICFPMRMIDRDSFSLKNLLFAFTSFAVCSIVSFYLTKFLLKNLDLIYSRYGRKQFSAINEQYLKWFLFAFVWILLLNGQFFILNSSSLTSKNQHVASVSNLRFFSFCHKIVFISLMLFRKAVKWREKSQV